MIASNKELAKRPDELEARIDRRLSILDQATTGTLDAIRPRMAPPRSTKKGRIGFVRDD
ncbi:MAG: hypothetical protein JJE42_03100 [Burkholderiales bacterium]|nr:hypothetical protein [Burkholderiales bacterium]